MSYEFQRNNLFLSVKLDISETTNFTSNYIIKKLILISISNIQNIISNIMMLLSFLYFLFKSTKFSYYIRKSNEIHIPVKF